MSMSSLEFLTEESCSEDEEENHSKENYADETDSDAKSAVCSSSRQSIENCKWEAELDAPSANKHEAIDNFHITDTICHEALQEALDVNNELNEIEDILPFNLLQARNNDVYKTDSTHDDECKEVVIEESMSVSSLVLVKEESCSEAEQECTNSEEHDITEGLPTRIDEHCRQSIIKGLEIFANEDLPDDLVEELLENSSKLLKFCYERGVNIQSQASEQAAKPSTEEIVDESSHHYQEPCQESNTLNTATSNQDVVQMDDNAEEYDQFHPSENLIDENGYEEDFEVSDIESDDVNSNSAMNMSTINFLTEESLGEDEEGLPCFEDVDMSEEVPELNDEARMEVPKPPINRKNQDERTCSNKRFDRRYKKLKSDTSTKHPHPPANLVQSVNEEATKSHEIEVCVENQSVNSVGMLPPLNKAPQLCDEAIQEAFDFDYNVGRFKTPSSCQRISELNDESGKDNENEKHLQTTTCSLNSFPEDQKTDKIQSPKKEFLECSDECHEETIPKVCLSETCSTSGLNVINTSNEKCIKNVEPLNVAKNSSDEAVKTEINDSENDISATHMLKKLSPIEATNNSDVKMDDNAKECDQSYPSDESVDVNGYEEEDFETSDIERDSLISNSSKNMSPINFIAKGSCSEDKEGSTCFENVEMFQEVSKVCDERLIEEHYKNENIPTECIKEMRPECNLISNDHTENRNDCLTNLNHNQLPHNLHDRISTEVNQSDSDCEEDNREDSMSSLVFLTEESSNEAEEECASHSEHDTHPSEVTEGIRREQLIKGLENLNYDNIPKKYVDEILKAENLANVCNVNQSDNGVESTHQMEQNIKKLIESSKQYNPSEMTNKMCKEGFTEVSEYDMDEFDECASGTSMSSRNNDKEKGKIDERNITKTCINENLSASKETDKIMDSNKTTYTTTIKSKSEEILVTDDNSSTDEDEGEELMSMSSLEFLTEESCSEPEEETNAKEENDAHKKSTTEESCSKPEEVCTYFDKPYAKPPPNIESRCREALMRGLEQFADEDLPEGFVNEILSRPGDLFKFWQDGKANNHVSSEESHVKLQKHEQLSKTEKLTKCLNKERTSSNSDDIQSSAYLTASSSDHPSVEDCSWEAELDAPSINKHQLAENCHITDTICNEALQEALDVNNELNEIDDLLPFNLSHPRNNAVYETDKDKIDVDKCKEVVSEESISISSLGLLKKESCSESEKERTNSEEHGITEENPTSVEEHCKKSLMKGLEIFANEDLPDDLVEELLGNPSKLLKFCYERGVNNQSQASDQAAKPCTEEMVDHIDNRYQEPCQDSNNLNNAASNQDAIKMDDSAEDYDQFYPSDESVDENGYAEEDFEVSDIESDDVISNSSMNMSPINFLTEESCSEKEEGSTCCEVVHMFEEVSEVCDETFIEEHQNNEGRFPEGCFNEMRPECNMISNDRTENKNDWFSKSDQSQTPHNLQDAINIVEMEVNQSELKYEYAVNKDLMSSLVLTTAERREAEEKGISHDEHDTESDNGVGSILVLEQNVQEVKQESSHQFKPSEFTKKICEKTLTEVYEYNMNEFDECASDTSMSSRNNDKEKGKSVENNIAENCIGEKLSALKETDKIMDSNKTTKKLEEVLVTDDNTSTDEDECEESMSMSSLEFLTEESCSEAEEETKANEENDAHEKSTTKESQPEEEYTYFDEPYAKPPPNIESRCREALMRGLEQFATEDLPVGFVDEILSRPGDLFSFWQDLKANNQSCEQSSSQESLGNGSCRNEKVKLQKYEKMNKTEKLNCLNKDGTSSNSDDIQSSAHECGKCNWEAELDAPSTNKHQVTENYQKITDTICNEALQEALDVNTVLNEVDDLLPFNLSHPRNNAVYETDNDNTDGDKCEEEEVVSEESMSVSSHGLLKEESCGEAEEECTNYEEHDTNEEHPASVEEHCQHSLMKGLEIFANEDLPDDFVEELLRKPSELLKFCYDRGVNIQSQASDQAAKPCTEDNVNDIGHHYQESCQESNNLNNAASKQADVKMDDNVKEYDQFYPFDESVDENGYEEEDFDVSDIESDDVISNSSMNMSLINFLTEESCTEDEEGSTCCADVKISEEAYKAYEEALMEEHHNNENIPEECTKELRHECNMISIDRAENGNDCLTNSDQSQIPENSHEVIRKKVDMDENQSDPECEEDGSEDSMSSLVFLREETCSEAEEECASHDEHDSDANPSEITEKSRKEALIKERASTYSGNGSENDHDKIQEPDAKNQRISDQMSTSGGSIPDKYNFEKTLSPSKTVPDVTDENKTLQKEPKESGKILSVTENDLAVKACNMDEKSKPRTMSVPYMLKDNSEIDDGKFQSMKTIIDAALKEVGSNDSTVPFKRVCRRSGTESSISDGVSSQKENQFSKQSGLDCQTLSSDCGSGLSNYRQVFLEMRDKYEAQIMEQQRLLQVHQLMAKQLQLAFDEKKELLSIVKSLHERVGQLEMKITNK
ncbi:uncharacterized protein LOC143469850 [Clavelina lepadiformis]|uniref:uncharacterized protein LOC143469850 n=1 Tax=Clavelina lepadiformis TaxID=159417 RepID=UPI0040415C59